MKNPFSSVKYGDLIKLDGTVECVTLSGKKLNIRFLDKVFCDGFTRIDDSEYIILNLDYLVSKEEFNKRFVSVIRREKLKLMEEQMD